MTRQSLESTSRCAGLQDEVLHAIWLSIASFLRRHSPSVGVKSIELEPLSLNFTLYRIQICTVNMNNTDKHEINLEIKVIVQKLKMVAH